LAHGHAGERLVQGAHDRRRRARVRLVGERFEHEREPRPAIVDRANERLELCDRALHSVGARLEDAEIPGRPLVVRRKLAPAFRGRYTLLRELELVREARRALRGAGLLREHRRGEKLARGRSAVLALERDVAEQQMRVDLDLGLRMDAVGRRCGRTGRQDRSGDEKPGALHPANITHGADSNSAPFGSL
jgi:hypothetical protein